jgi:streptogramin lyase
LVTLDGCETAGAVCGEVEYLDMAQDDVVFCASELTLTAHESDTFSFSERYVYRGWMCLPTTFTMTRTADGGLDVEQFVEPSAPCCRGSMTAHSGPAAPAVPGSLGALGIATSATALGGATTQYPGIGPDSLWLPLEDRGAVARIDPATGALIATVETGDPGSLAGMKSDPHSVVVGEAGIWIAQAAAHAVGRIDPATNAITDKVALPVIPYALALDGTTLWVSSFEDDRVVRVDLSTRTVVAEVAVNKPTGIAVGQGGVWVVRHRDDVLVRISPKTNKVIATIELPMRPWAIGAGAGRIWASQFTGSPDGAFLDQASWAIASIDPATGKATSFPFPGALGVFWADDALWAIQPGRRGDVLVRVELAGS